MAVTSRRRRTVPGMQSIALHDFSGGLNIRDEATELAPTESPDMMNVTLNERGAVLKRLGYADDGAMAAEAADITNLYYSGFLANFVHQAGTLIRERTAAGVFATIDTRTTAARVAFADFISSAAVARRLYYVHPVDGVYRNDGATGTNVSTTVKGNCIAPWQNKLWVAGDSSNPARVWWSNAGTGDTWTTAEDFVDLREKDDEPITALAATRNGLLVFKRRSTYRITDSATGANELIDGNAGAAGPMAVTQIHGRVCVINELGIHVTDGLSELVLASGSLEPLFTRDQLALAEQGDWCAGSYRDRVFFSITRFGKTRNDLTLEFHPLLGWVVPHSFGAAAFAQLRADDNQLYHASSGAARRIYKTFSGGSDQEDSAGARSAAAEIACRFQTPWLNLSGDSLFRLRRARVNGRGAFTLGVRYDYRSDNDASYDLDLTTSGATFDSSDTYDSGALWGPTSLHVYNDIYSLGVGKAVSFALSESSVLTESTPELLGDGSAETVGSIALYGLKLDFVDLTYA